MKGLEHIYHKKKIVATIFRKNISVSGLKFFTDLHNPFQIGIHQKSKGIKLAPHIHRLEKPLIIKTIQEILFVIKGKIRVTLYSKEGKVISRKILKKGDCVLFIDKGHGVDFLEDSRVFEIKQGPYPGSQFAKIYYNK